MGDLHGKGVRSRQGIALALLLAHAGCVGTPVPQPPAYDPPDATLLDFDGTSSVPQFAGGPGAAPADTTLWVTLFDRPDDATEVPVAADGSFVVPLPSPLADGEELRLSVRGPAGRSAPVDVRAPNPAPATFPTQGCLLFDAELEVPASGTARLELTNDCGSVVTIDAARLRVGADFTIVDPGPLTVPMGARGAFEVSRVAGTPEEILFLDISVPAIARRPVSLIGVP